MHLLVLSLADDLSVVGRARLVGPAASAVETQLLLHLTGAGELERSG